MGLLRNFFRGREQRDTQPQSSQFHETESTAQRANSANAARRELVQVALRDTMRKHAIPADWIDCRMLSVVTRQRRAGMHVQFIVRKSQTQLLASVHEFQRSFWHGIEQFDPRARDWLFSIAWQFDGADDAASPSPGPDFSDVDTEPAGDTQPPELDDELQTDLRALYAIRDAALAEAVEPAATSPQRSDPSRS
jgi:hypothetical protein